MNPIIFVAPFKEIADTAHMVISEMKLNIPVVIATNIGAIEAIKAYPETNIIISRGGTAADLSAVEGKTIVEVNASFIDIFSSIEMLSRKGCKKIGVVSRDNIIDNSIRDFAYSDMQVHVRPCKNDNEIKACVKELHSECADAIIGCHMAVDTAKKMKMITTYVESSKVSIRKAINEAFKIFQSKEVEHLQLERLNAVINNIQEGIIIFDKKQEAIFYNRLANQIFAHIPKDEWYKKMNPHLEETQQEKLIEVGDNKLLFKSIPLHIDTHGNNKVFVFQEVQRIENTERKIRLSSYDKGLYAKIHFEDIICFSENMREIILLAKKFAGSLSNVLICGETGTGKEGIAQSIHNHSSRASNPFVSVNCASLPPNLIESELFGYVDGAFTGARRNGKRGLFEIAHKGTIFLDEIGELPLDVQSRLLRVLQEREIMRIGDDKIMPLDMRVVCATNKNLKELVQKGLFREDLYYRINVLKLQLPPLRERKQDILPLLDFYIKRHIGNNVEFIISKDALKCLHEYSWPGNIRELKNIAEVLAFENKPIIDEKQVIAAFDGSILPDKSFKDYWKIPCGYSLKEVEQVVIKNLLAENTPEAVCSRLGISRVTLWRKLK